MQVEWSVQQYLKLSEFYVLATYNYKKKNLNW